MILLRNTCFGLDIEAVERKELSSVSLRKRAALRARRTGPYVSSRNRADNIIKKAMRIHRVQKTQRHPLAAVR